MSHDEQDVQTDLLFVGLTRPATVLGVPYIAFVVEFMTTALIFLAVGNPVYLLLAAPIHAILYLISANDPGIFGSVFVWMKTTARCRNSRFWGSKREPPKIPSSVTEIHRQAA